jgi:two-component system nitrogen regulation response regulator GlnG
MASSREVYLADLPPELAAQETVISQSGDWTEGLHQWADQQLSLGNVGILNQATPMFERTMIEIALKHTAGRRRDAANLLGWGRNTLTRKIKELSSDEEKPEIPAD